MKRKEKQATGFKFNFDAPQVSTYQQVKEETHAAKPSAEPKSDPKVVITGDDVLIEYVSRLIQLLKEVPETHGVERPNQCIEKFITHFVWHQDDEPKRTIWRRLENRLNEMLSRRKKLLKNLTRKEFEKRGEEIDDLEIERIIKEKEGQKLGLLQNFKVNYLENMLKSSTKSVAKDVVSTLIDPLAPEGTLVQLTKVVENLPEYEEEEKEIRGDSKPRSVKGRDDSRERQVHQRRPILARS